MTKIKYVVTIKSDYVVEAIVYYTSGTHKTYDLVTGTMPDTVKKFCVTAKNCDVDEYNTGVLVTTETYYN